jgi:hypothetical protein
MNADVVNGKFLQSCKIIAGVHSPHCMQIKRTVSLIGATLAVAVIGIVSTPVVEAQSGPSQTFSSRLATQEEGTGTNKVFQLASSVATQTLNWNSGSFFVWTNLATNVTVNLSNVTVGREIEIFADGDGTARNITLATNGSTGLNIVYDLTPLTNGSPSFICTNYARVSLKAVPGVASGSKIIYVRYMVR